MEIEYLKQEIEEAELEVLIHKNAVKSIQEDLDDLWKKFELAKVKADTDTSSTTAVTSATSELASLASTIRSYKDYAELYRYELDSAMSHLKRLRDEAKAIEF